MIDRGGRFGNMTQTLVWTEIGQKLLCFAREQLDTYVIVVGVHLVKRRMYYCLYRIEPVQDCLALIQILAGPLCIL